MDAAFMSLELHDGGIHVAWPVPEGLVWRESVPGACHGRRRGPDWTKINPS
jgi:hypothetical protein